MRRRVWIGLLTLSGILAVIYFLRKPALLHISGPLPQDAYVWQRAWSPELREVVASQTRFGRLVILAAEISPRDGKVVRISLPTLSREVGLAIRIGPLPANSSDPLPLILQTVTDTLAEARKAGLKVAELQIDYDCADSKLSQYGDWLVAIKKLAGLIPVIPTVLPSWLKRDEFAALAKEAGAYVLQVHSLHRPTGPDVSMTLCDAEEARQAVATASKLNIPFRVALPTYTYIAGFSAGGEFLGMQADGPALNWPDDAIRRPMRADPTSLAALVRDWTNDCPPSLTGIIWYRLPAPEDHFNWRMETLEAVMQGREPKANLQAHAVHTNPGQIDIYLMNAGEADAPIDLSIRTTWADASLIGADSINAFAILDSGDQRVTFHPANSRDWRWIRPGERLQIGWIRLSSDKEVHVELLPKN